MRTFKQLRLLQVMTQPEFSEYLQMDLWTYGKLERGQIQPRTGTIKKIARILKLEPREVQMMIEENQKVARAAAGGMHNGNH